MQKASRLGVKRENELEKGEKEESVKRENPKRKDHSWHDLNKGTAREERIGKSSAIY